MSFDALSDRRDNLFLLWYVFEKRFCAIFLSISAMSGTEYSQEDA